MPTKKTLKKPNIGKVLMKLPIQSIGSKLVYILLLVAFLIIGYLFAKVEMLQKGSVAVAPSAPAAPNAQAPQEPTAPDPEKVKKDLKMGHLPVKGDPNAKVTIVEFSDFECPFCGRFYSETLPQLIKEYVDTGKAKLYFRHYPLPFHPKATPLALASECANDQGKFWEMHDKIFDATVAGTSSTSTDADYTNWAGELGLDTSSFDNCYTSKKYQKNVDEDTAAGSAVGVSGTPTFYINGKQLVGALPFDSFKAIIDEELK